MPVKKTFQYHRDARLPTIRDVMVAVSTTWNIPVDWLTNPRRSPGYSEPRHIAMAIARRLTKRSYPELGRRFTKHHTTVLHGARKFKWLMDEVEQIVGPESDALDWSGAALTILRSQKQ
jgi:chromosomal replication initiation ATPase DnaA